MVTTAAVADPNLSRQLASNLLEALKQAGHILIAKGKSEALLRELATEIESTLARVIPRILRTEVVGEVTSTFGDEATDEAVEELVERLREHIIDSEGIEDVFAEDKVIERIIFRTLHEGLVHSAHVESDEDQEEPPPISVRLDTLGYVASTASKLSDSATLKDALERAALSASTELDTFDPGARIAFFAASDDDPDKRLEIEEAVEEELADLVEMGLVDLPTAVRQIPLPRVPAADERKALRAPLNELAARVLTSRVCPGTWDWDGTEAIKLTFTPMSEFDAKTVDALVSQFTRGLESVLEKNGPGAPVEPIAATAKGAEPKAGSSDDTPASKRKSPAVATTVTDRLAKSASGKGAPTKAVAPKAVAPKAVTPKAVTPKTVAPKAGASKVDPKAGTPKGVAPKAVAPNAIAPKAASPKAVASKAAPSKKTPAAPAKASLDKSAAKKGAAKKPAAAPATKTAKTTKPRG